FFRRIRELAKGVAVSYGEQRKSLEYPLLKETTLDTRKSNIELSNIAFPNIASSFLLEIGVEELPANDVDTAYAALSARVPTLLQDLNLAHGDVRIFTPPRGLVVSVASLSPNQPDREDLVKGPPADKAIVDSAGGES